MGPQNAAKLPSQQLGAVAARGFAWLSIQTLVTKLLSVTAQLVLAMLLAKEDFGLVAMALSVSTFASLVQQMGIRDVLIHRHRTFRRWATSAFWMSLILGTTAGAGLAAISVWAGDWFDSPEVTGLILVLALAVPLRAMAVVPEARLRSALQFRFIAIVGCLQAATVSGLAVVLAVLDFGAFSFVIPQVVASGIVLACYWWVARPPISGRLNFKRWRFLIGDSSALLVGNFCVLITAQADFFILGLLHSSLIVGIYYFAFGLSTQTVTLLTTNLSGVLFPSLSKLQHDPSRQVIAYLRAARILAIVGVPLGFLQAALADPGLRLLFDDKWIDAITVLQVLSIGMAFRAVGSSAGSLLQAQGRFLTIMKLSILYALVFVALVATAAWLGQAIAVAAAVTVYFCIVIGLFHFYMSIRSATAGWREVIRVYAAPVAAAGTATAIAAWIGTMVPAIPYREFTRLAVTISIAAAIYVPFIYLLAPDACGELIARLRGLIARHSVS